MPVCVCVCVCFFALVFFFIHSSSNSSVRWLVRTFVCSFVFVVVVEIQHHRTAISLFSFRFCRFVFIFCHVRNVVCTSMSLSCIFYCESKRLHSACVCVERAVVIASLVHANTNFGGKYFFFHGLSCAVFQWRWRRMRQTRRGKRNEMPASDWIKWYQMIW